MALRVSGVKRSREPPPSQQARTQHRRRLQQQQQQYDPCAMVVDANNDDPHALVFADDPGGDADREDGDDDAVESYFSSSDGNTDQPPRRRKRAMLIRANIQYLQKLPPLSNYQRGASGRRGGVDGGTPDSDIGMHALEATMNASSVSAGSWSSRVAVVAPVHHPAAPVPVPHVHSLRRNASIAFAAQASSQQQQRRPAMTTASKDDEARPATSGSWHSGR